MHTSPLLFLRKGWGDVGHIEWVASCDTFCIRPPPPPTYQAEVDVNISVDVSSLVSSANLPERERQGADADAEDGRERFYLTTAINYTNGAI